MGRIEDNNIMVERHKEIIDKNIYGSCQQILNLTLGMLNEIMTDISKSLAIIADSVTEKEGD